MGAAADVEGAFSSNVTGTFNVLRSAGRSGVKRLVFTSSREVYGEPAGMPVAESAPLRPKNAYGSSKAAGEMCCAMAADSGLETVVLRLANVYGPGDEGRVLPIFLNLSS
jgi:nucleoside-diphosphate-sugar epimerase